MYIEVAVDPVEARWHQEMIDNPEAKYCFVVSARNVFREVTPHGNAVMRQVINEMIELYCKEQNIDTWYYAPENNDSTAHLLYVSTSSWIVELRMTMGTQPSFMKYFMRHLDHVEERNDL